MYAFKLPMGPSQVIHFVGVEYDSFAEVVGEIRHDRVLMRTPLERLFHFLRVGAVGAEIIAPCCNLFH